jgi:hypothetical protein
VRKIKTTLVAMLIAVGAAHSAHAASPVVVAFHAAAGSQVHGFATLTAHSGGSMASFRLRGLPPAGVATAYLRAGTCSDQTHLSASSAFIANMRATLSGTVSISKPVSYHGTPVRLAVVTDGGHVLVVSLGNRLAACGNIPRSVSH